MRKNIKIIGDIPDQVKDDLSYVLFRFRKDNPDMSIDKVVPITRVVLESAGIENQFEVFEDFKSIRVSIGKIRSLEVS